MPPTARRATNTFRRRAATGAFVGGALQAVGWLAIGWAATQLGVRLWGSWLAPHAWWAALLAPALLFGWWRMARTRLTAGSAAAHLDRRLGLDGLLLCAHDGPPLDPAWQDRLDERLAALPGVLPATRWRALLPLPLLAVLLAAGVALLPPPELPPSTKPLPAIQAELEKMAVAMRDLFERGNVPEEVQQELRQQLDQLRHDTEAGEVPEWRDLDQLDRRLEREQLLQVLVAQLPRNAAGADPREGGSKAPSASPQQLAAMAKALVDLGMLDRLPPDVLAELRKLQSADGTFAAEALALDPAMLARLAEAFGGMLGELGSLEGLEGLVEGIDPATLADLRQLVAQYGTGRLGGGEQGNGPGTGGVSRGPGRAALSLTDPAQGGADAAMPLPPGHALPGEWVPVGSTRIDPVVDPVRPAATGGAAATGAGGATWQLHLAPRHRAVLQRFFGTTDSKDKK